MRPRPPLYPRGPDVYPGPWLRCSRACRFPLERVWSRTDGPPRPNAVAEQQPTVADYITILCGRPGRPR